MSKDEINPTQFDKVLTSFLDHRQHADSTHFEAPYLLIQQPNEHGPLIKVTEQAELNNFTFGVLGRICSEYAKNSVPT